MVNSEREYAEQIYESMYECGQRLTKEQKERETKMKDDSLSDTQKIPGGYCRKCNTVWCYPGKCNCDVNSVGINIKPLLAGSGNQLKEFNYGD